ncbi:MAG: MFS transporter [Rhodanobacter sp.]
MTQPRNAWPVVIAYAFAASAAMGLQLIYAPVTTVAAQHYQTSVAAIGWLSEVFPLMYVLVSIPAGLLLDRWFRASLILGAALIAGGALIRQLNDTFYWALAGQLVAAVGQPLILNGITKLASNYLRERDRPLGIAIAMASVYVGQLLAIALGSILSTQSQLSSLTTISTLYTVIVAIGLVVCLRRPGSFVAAGEASPGLSSLLWLWKDPFIRSITVIAFIGIGSFTALLTWLQALLEPAGVPPAASGSMLLGMIIAGIVGTSILPVRVARLKKEYALMLIASVIGVIASLVLAFIPSVWTGMIAMPVDGLLLLAVMPIILEVTERRAGPNAGTATAMIWMAGNAGALIIAMAVQALVTQPTIALIVMSAISASAIPLVLLLRRQALTPPRQIA